MDRITIILNTSPINVTVRAGLKGEKGDPGIGAVAINGSAVLHFPLFNKSEEETTVTTVANALITNATFKNIQFVPVVSSDHDSLDDFAWDGLSFNIENIIDNTSFDIRARATHNSWGNYNVNYIILN